MRNYFTRSGRVSRRDRRVRLHLEALEDRTLLNGTNPLLVTNLNDSGDGSLRAAVMAADATSGATIDFANGLHGTIKLKSELDITSNMTIDGPGAKRLAVSGNDVTRAFRIATDAKAEIDGLTITHGLASGAASSEPFPGFGGGVLNQGDLTLKDDVISHNQAVGAANVTITVDGKLLRGNGSGGGVANLGTLDVSDSTFTDNQARGASQNITPEKTSNDFPGFGGGGGLANLGAATATVMNCQFTRNLAQGGNGSINNYVPGFAGDAGGGAIENVCFASKSVATLTVSGSHFSNNQAIGGDDNRSTLLPGLALGGAIYSQKFASTGGIADLDVSDSTFDHNQAIGGNHNVVLFGSESDTRAQPNFAAGGAIFVQSMGTISDSMFDHNQAIGGQGIAAGSDVFKSTRNGGSTKGGGIDAAFPGTIVTVSDCTIEHNLAIGGQAGAGGNGGNATGGGVANGSTGAILTITGCTIDHNKAQGGSADASASASSGGSGLGGGVYNISGSTTEVIDSSISHNQAFGASGKHGGDGGDGLGGGFYNAGSATLTNDTIEFNKAKAGAAGMGGSPGTADGGGVYNDLALGGSITLVGMNVIRHNKPNDCVGC